MRIKSYMAIINLLLLFWRKYLFVLL